MKITPKILSIPPYLSTTWKNISSLVVREEETSLRLIVILQSKAQVEIPGLDRKTVNEIFEAHAKHSEPESPPPLDPIYGMTLPIKADGTGDILTSSMQHNPEQKDLPPLPEDVLKKISTIAKAFGLEELSVLPQPEEGCNCMFCQVVRSLYGNETASQEEEIVSEEDLKFKSWDIEETSERLYKVTNPLDQNEHYNVFLGEPLGCTCGEKNCEHLRAVLST